MSIRLSSELLRLHDEEAEPHVSSCCSRVNVQKQAQKQANAKTNAEAKPKAGASKAAGMQLQRQGPVKIKAKGRGQAKGNCQYSPRHANANTKAETKARAGASKGTGQAHLDRVHKWIAPADKGAAVRSQCGRNAGGVHHARPHTHP